MTTTEKNHNNAVLASRLAQLVQDVIDGNESPAVARQIISDTILANADLAELGQLCLSQIPKEPDDDLGIFAARKAEQDATCEKEKARIAAVLLAEKIILGDKNSYGMLNCLDGYYRDAFDDDLAKFEELKTKAGL
jgi:hypothetical protein